MRTLPCKAKNMKKKTSKPQQKSEKSVFSDRERKLLNAINEHIYVKEAAGSIGITVRTAYNILYRLRKKYLKAQTFVNTILAQKRRSPLLSRVLTKKVDIEILEKVLGTRPIDLFEEGEED